MYLGINNYGMEDVVNDEAWKDLYKKDAKAVGLGSSVAYAWAGYIFFYFQGNPYGYGGDYSQNFLKEQSFGRWKQQHIVAIRNTRLDYELYGDDDVRIVRLGNIRFGYRERYPGNKMSSILDSVDGRKIIYDDNGRIVKIGYQTI